MEFNQIISSKKIKEDAENYFRGGFYCSEAVIASIRDNFNLPLPIEIIQMASGFPVGIGRSKCLCGAVSGGVMALGIFFGRTIQKDPKSEACLTVSKELHDYFKSTNGALCCRILTRGMDMASGEHKEQCIRFTGEVAEKVAQIVVRELSLTDTDALAVIGG